MAPVHYRLLLLEILVASRLSQVSSQVCYSLINCQGDPFPALTARECCVGTDEGFSFSADGVTCSVTQCIVHGFSNASFDVVEGGRLDTTFETNVKGTTNVADIIFLGTITSEAITAQVDDFEAFPPIHLEESGTHISVSIRMYIRNDEVTLEYDDQVALKFNPRINNFVQQFEDNKGEFIRNTATVTIVDKNRLQLSFEETKYIITEGEELGIRMQFKKTQSPFALTLRPVSIADAEAIFNVGNFINFDQNSTAIPGSDFTTPVITVRIPAAEEDSGAISTFQLPAVFAVVDDDVNENSESFALVAEIGDDVPKHFACFQKMIGNTECYARTGAAEISIADNDVMVIGFSRRSQIISESYMYSSLQPDIDIFPHSIDVHSLRTSKFDYELGFRILEASSTATILPILEANWRIADAVFGFRNSDGDITVHHDLSAGYLIPNPTLYISIGNDFVPGEKFECFTLRIFNPDTAYRTFSCNEDGLNVDGYFCQHTLCIEDDDEPFVVRFVQTVYTVTESDGQVEVCVNLARPEVDILDETLRVEVYRDDNSVYIPLNSTVATPITDYEEQIQGTNSIRDTVISATRRTVCYNQSIYDDMLLETSEYIGLTLAVRDATIPTEVEPMYDHAAIMILDDESFNPICYYQTDCQGDSFLAATAWDCCAGTEEGLSFSADGNCTVAQCIVHGFPRLLYNVTEGQRLETTFGINVKGVTPFPTLLSGSISSLADTARSSDFEKLQPVQTRGASVDIKLITIDDDIALEYDDTVTLQFNPQDPQKILQLKAAGEFIRDTAVLNIIDNDQLEISFEEAVYSIVEDVSLSSPIRVEFTKTQSPFTLIVRLVSTDYAETGFNVGNFINSANISQSSQATPMFDFTLELYSVTVPATEDDVGTTSTFGVAAGITVREDNVDELKQSFALVALIGDSVADNVTCFKMSVGDTQCFGRAGATRIEISDQGAEVGLNETYYLVKENMGVVDVCVTVLSPTDICGFPFAFNVSLSISDGTAVYAADYDAQSTILMFDACESLVCLPVLIVDDDELDKADRESIIVSLERTADLDNRIILDGVRGVIEIEDDEVAEVGLERTSYHVTEDVGMVEVCATVHSPSIDCAIPFSFNLTLSIIDASAEFPSDYIAESTILMFDACESSKCLPALIIDDRQPEDRESFTVTLEGTPHLSSNLKLEPNRSIVEIDDNDGGDEALTAGVIAAITLSVLVVIAIAGVIVLVFICRYKTKKRESRPQVPISVSDNKKDTSVHGHYIELSSLDKTRQSTLLKQLHEQLKNKKMIISKNQLHLSDIVGQGESGVVYKAYINKAIGTDLVAVKTGKALFSMSDMERLTKEVSTMLSFEHPNVMSLIGVCLDGDMPLLIMPFMSNGSVLQYVKQHKQELLLGSEASEVEIQTTRKTLLGICHQIAKGMEYLSKECFVHRDLAARNCMIAQSGVIKVGDFGLTEDAYCSNYYRRTKSVTESEEKIPIRWMAPESIENDIYNESTDVWGFGVTVWEIFTCGRVPYSGIPAMSLLRALQTGQRLEKPNNAACSNEVYEIKTSCWKLDPHERSNFRNLVNWFSDLLERDGGYLELSPSPSSSKKKYIPSMASTMPSIKEQDDVAVVMDTGTEDTL